LGMKQCTPNPWEEFAATHNKNDKITGKIKSITDFGVFIGLDGGIDGLIHLSDLTWDRPGEAVVRADQKGDEVEAVVLSVDPERERISLGIKQSLNDPFAAFVGQHGEGDIVRGTVAELDAKGAVVKLADGVDGYLRATELSRDHVEDARSVLAEDQEIEAKITSIERKNRKISLSVKALEIEMQEQAMQEFSRRSTTGSATLGEKLKEELSKQSS